MSSWQSELATPDCGQRSDELANVRNGDAVARGRGQAHQLPGEGRPTYALPDPQDHQGADESQRQPDQPPATVIFSVRNTSTAIGSTTSGVIEFQIPARTEETRCSPKANRLNGAATPTTATTA